MTLRTIAFYRKCPFAVVAEAAGFAVLHLCHGDLFVFLAVRVKLVVTVVAGKLHAIDMGSVAEQDITAPVLQGNVSAPSAKNRRCQHADQCNRKYVAHFAPPCKEFYAPDYIRFCGCATVFNARAMGCRAQKSPDIEDGIGACYFGSSR